MIIGCSIVGISLAVLGHRYGLTLTPLAILYAYVLYPRVEPALAWYVAFVAVMALVIANVKGKR